MNILISEASGTQRLQLDIFYCTSVISYRRSTKPRNSFVLILISHCERHTDSMVQIFLNNYYLLLWSSSPCSQSQPQEPLLNHFNPVHTYRVVCSSVILFTTAFRTALGPTQPPIQWVSGAASLGYSGRGVKLTTQFYLVPKLRMSGDMPSLTQYALLA